jgi:photosystem II stability/assembly factor-like uncharacterized protein
MALRKIILLLLFYSIEAFSQPFPFSIGDKWFYRMNSYMIYDLNHPIRTSFVIREIVDTSASGVRKVSVKYDNWSTPYDSVEYWTYQNGMLYISLISDPVYISSLSNDSSYWSIIHHDYFGSNYKCQNYYNYVVYPHSGAYGLSTSIADSLGLVFFYDNVYGIATNRVVDSTFILGAFINHTLFGDSTNSVHPVVAPQWELTSMPWFGAIRSFAISGKSLFAGTDGGGIFLSTDNGNSWTAVNNGLTTNYVYSLAISGTNLFAGTYEGVFLSTNNGTSWIAKNKGLGSTNKFTYALALDGTNLFAGTYGCGIFLSTNNGTSWTPIYNATGGVDFLYITSLAVSGANLFAGCNRGDLGGGVFLSTDKGTNWVPINNGLTNPLINSLFVSDTNLFTGCKFGAFLSTNSGLSWTDISNDLRGWNWGGVTSFARGDTSLFVGTNGGGVFLSTNNGQSWTSVNNGLTDLYISSLAISDTNLFIGTASGSVWRSLFKVTGSKLNNVPLPSVLRLYQNYPNPFNTITNISFTLPSESFVSLKVFDILGREVSMLANEVLPAGYYTRQWNALYISSGVYFSRLHTKESIATKKMLLLK